jgi:hypothetical protein
MEQSITVTPDIITIKAQFFVHKDYSVTGKELIYDVFSNYFQGQRVVVQAFDGENITYSGFETFIQQLQKVFDIVDITIESHQTTQPYFNHKKLVLGIFVSTGRDIPEFVKDTTDAKFVGATLGRFSPIRLRLAYELDKAFPTDNFMTFQPTMDLVKDSTRHVSQLYSRELAWLETKQFDRDLASSHRMGMIDWHTANSAYPNIWNNYQIEVVSETDARSKYWFTEKTARCLATGKPFVLLAGRGSLHTLREMGFRTFWEIIDEGYDERITPTLRISHLISSLQKLYTDPNRPELIKRLYSIAQENIKIYKDFCSNQRET